MHFERSSVRVLLHYCEQDNTRDVRPRLLRPTAQPPILETARLLVEATSCTNHPALIRHATYVEFRLKGGREVLFCGWVAPLLHSAVLVREGPFCRLSAPTATIGCMDGLGGRAANGIFCGTHSECETLLPVAIGIANSLPLIK